MSKRISRPRDPAMIAIGAMLAIGSLALADRWFWVMTFPYDLLGRPWILL